MVHQMRFEWDPVKSEGNLRKHGVAFEEARTVFDDPVSITFDDLEHSTAEERAITVGYSDRGRLLIVCHTRRETSIRLISARRATREERRRHEA